MTRTMSELSPDAQTLLGLVGRRHGMGGDFRTGDIEAMHPRGNGGEGQDMTVPEISAALGELSQRHGWLGTFRPGLYVFRAYASGADGDGRLGPGARPPSPS